MANPTPPPSPTPTPTPTQAGGFDMNKASIIALLYLAGFVVGFTGVVGVILAFVWKDEVAGTWEESHLQFHIITFLGGLVGSVVGIILSIVLIGIPILIAVAIWVLIRSLLALLKAQKQEAVADPKGWMLP